jgi:hypothetical protein
MMMNSTILRTDPFSSTFNAVQYVFWQAEIKIIDYEDDRALVPVDYSTLGFDIFLRQPFSCHSWTIKAGIAAWVTSKIK